MNISLEIKKLLAKKRKARVQWQRSHILSDKTAFNRLSSNLKSKLKAMGAHPFPNYASTLRRYDNSIWKPIKSSRKPILAMGKERKRKSSSIRETPRGRIPTAWAGNWQRNAGIPGITKIIRWAHKTNHAKGYKRRNRTLKYEKSTWHGLNNPKNAKGITPRKAWFYSPTYSVPFSDIIIGLKLKLAEIILIPKPGKDPKEVKSYRPTTLLPIIAKLLGKRIPRRIDPDFSTSDWTPHHQFGFRRAHSTIQQCHRITHTILKALNNQEYCTLLFLAVSQAFHRIWHPGLL